MEPLAALDSVFVTMDAPNAPLHVGALIELEPSSSTTADPSARFDEIRATIEERLGNIAVLRRRVVRVPFDLGPPLLVDDPEFDISFHVVRRAVPAPGGPRQVEDLVARIMARPLSPDRPLWEISVIEGLESGGTALLAKVHHALADGVSGVTIFAGLFDLSSDHVPAAPAPPLDDAEPVPTPVELLARSSSELLRRPGAVLEALGASLERLAGTVDAMVGTTVDPDELETKGPSILDAPTTSLSGTVSYARNFERFCLDVGEVKAAAGRHGGTVTDFAMGIVGGALRELLAERGELPAEDLISFVPVNIRVPGTEGELGNKISGRLVPLQTLITDPVERLAAIAEQNREFKETHEAPSDFLNELAEAAGPAVASLAGRVISAFDLFDHLPNVANVIISSVPGPPVPLWCAGERIVRATPMGPLMFNQALNITLLGYCGTLEFGVLGCARRVPDSARLLELLELQAAALLDPGAVAGSIRSFA